MNLKDELTALSAEGEQSASSPDVAALRARANRRRAVRTAVPAAVVAVVVVVLASVLVPLRGHNAEPAAPTERCGFTVADAAADLFGVEVYADDGPVTLRVSGNRVQELGGLLGMAAELTHAASGVDAFTVVPTADGTPLAAWLTIDGEVVGTLAPENVSGPEGAVGPGTPQIMDSAWTPLDCDGQAIPPGEYEIVAAVGVAPGADATAPTAVVLSAPYPVRLDDPNPHRNLGWCGSDWPGADVVEQTNGWELGLRVDSDMPDKVSVSELEDIVANVLVTNRSGQALDGWTGHPVMAVVDGDAIVGGTRGVRDIGLPGNFAPDVTLTYEAGDFLTRCDGTPLSKGTYDLFAVMNFSFTDPAGDDGPEGNRTDVTVIGGPWTFRIR